MIPERIDPHWDAARVCDFSQRWRISLDLALRLVVLSDRLPWGVQIISGHRTNREQDELRRQGRPTAPNSLSTHTACPASGADLQLVGITPTEFVKAQFGRAVMETNMYGARNAPLLRWGGGGAYDPDTGIPDDWNHVDLGPRMDTEAQQYRQENP